MASHIQRLTGGELFSIQVEQPYPSNYDDCLDRAADELDGNARRRSKLMWRTWRTMPIVFLGMPNWWYSCPMAVLTFVEEYDFSGKTVIPLRGPWHGRHLWLGTGHERLAAGGLHGAWRPSASTVRTFPPVARPLKRGSGNLNCPLP